MTSPLPATTICLLLAALGPPRVLAAPAAVAAAAARSPGAAALVRGGGRGRVGDTGAVVGAGPAAAAGCRCCSGWAGWGSRPGGRRAAPPAARRPHAPGACLAPLRLLPLGPTAVRRGLLGARRSPSPRYAAGAPAVPAALGAGDVKLAAPLGAVLGAGVVVRARAGRRAGGAAHRRRVGRPAWRGARCRRRRRRGGPRRCRTARRCWRRPGSARRRVAEPRAAAAAGPGEKIQPCCAGSPRGSPTVPLWSPCWRAWSPGWRSPPRSSPPSSPAAGSATAAARG